MEIERVNEAYKAFNTRADPQTVDVEDLGKAITLFENDIFANSPNQLRTILQAARAYLTLTKRGG